MQVVICSQLIEHMHKDEGIRLLSEIYRVLSPGGMLLIYTPSYYNFPSRRWPYHLYVWKPGELKDQLVSAGFSNIRFLFSAYIEGLFGLVTRILYMVTHATILAGGANFVAYKQLIDYKVKMSEPEFIGYLNNLTLQME
jgi:SAM-dependent methyltransferase